MSASITWKTVVTSSSILSLALLGYALICAVLPVHAKTFGINLIRVGVLLSANRFARVSRHEPAHRLVLDGASPRGRAIGHNM